MTVEVPIPEEFLECRKCELHKSRTHIVYGRGNVFSKLLILGEAPGEDEDNAGIPFVGKGGKLLDIWLGLIGLTVGDYFIWNTCLCRPPNNRRPFEEEVEACSDRKQWIMNMMKPKIIVTLGNVATRGLLGHHFPSVKYSHGCVKVLENNMKVMAFYHPGYVLRNPKLKESTVTDLLTLKELISKE